MADKYWFKHDYNARNDEKLLELRSEFGAEGYGIFWMLMEKMAEHEHGWLDGRLKGGLSIDLGIDKNLIQKITDWCLSVNLLMKNEQGFLYNTRMSEHKKMRLYLSESGKKGVKQRETNKLNKPPLKGGISHPSTDKIREEYNNVNISFDVFWNLYDYKVGNKDKLNVKWSKLTDEERIKIIATIPNYKNATPEKKYRKHPDTYFNNKSWNDEIIIRKIRPQVIGDGRPAN